jgi:hypothetical protein
MAASMSASSTVQDLEASRPRIHWRAGLQPSREIRGTNHGAREQSTTPTPRHRMALRAQEARRVDVDERLLEAETVRSNVQWAGRASAKMSDKRPMVVWMAGRGGGP